MHVAGRWVVEEGADHRSCEVCVHERSRTNVNVAPTSQKVRLRKWIRPDLQLKLVLVTMLVAISVLLINYQTCLMTLWSLELSLIHI